jgi:hypothetical protein
MAAPDGVGKGSFLTRAYAIATAADLIDRIAGRCRQRGVLK